MKHLETFKEKFTGKSMFGMAPLLPLLGILLVRKFNSLSDVLELIETDENSTYQSEYISKLGNAEKVELIDLLECAMDGNVEFLLDIELRDLCIVLDKNGHDLHIDVSDVNAENLHRNYMKLYNKYSSRQFPLHTSC